MCSSNPPVQILGQLVLSVLLDQLVEHPGGDGGRDPLPGVDATVDPHGRLVPAATLAHLGGGGAGAIPPS